MPERISVHSLPRRNIFKLVLVEIVKGFIGDGRYGEFVGVKHHVGVVFEKGAVIGKCGRSANLECFTVKIYRIAYFYAVVFGVKSVDEMSLSSLGNLPSMRHILSTSFLNLYTLTVWSLERVKSLKKRG